MKFIDNFQTVKYKNKKYIVLAAKYKSYVVPFVIDGKFMHVLSSIKQKWNYKKTGGYIASTFKTKNGEKEIFIHDMIMNLHTNYKPPNNYIIEHINTIGLDNRLANLRFTSDKGTRNQKKKKRTVKLPRGCGIKADDIPTYVWYVKESGNHGPRFVVEIPQNDSTDPIKWKTTSSKKVSLKYKLEEAKKFLRQLQKEKPHVFQNNCMNGEFTQEGKRLLDEFYDIINLAGYKNINKLNLNNITNKYIAPSSGKLSKKEKQLLEKNENLVGGNLENKRRRLISNLPKNCGITMDDLPKYSYYRPAYENRGEYFVVENHPKQKKRLWQTTTSKKVSIMEKYEELMYYLDNL